ncbi:hypothetical protein CIPAW_05G190500 [Carya illinoinensis]|uniref:Uncharacterized protein n=1 Tax=Carya illinoinensis TaxID=32201 RepID=A0A8T1QM26_CARIL|nr:hypothetical protein CIPAW_05G190500 [Carya illinoinensis]
MCYHWKKPQAISLILLSPPYAQAYLCANLPLLLAPVGYPHFYPWVAVWEWIGYGIQTSFSGKKRGRLGLFGMKLGDPSGRQQFQSIEEF